MKIKLDSFHLKIIAITGMLINHTGIIFEWVTVSKRCLFLLFLNL